MLYITDKVECGTADDTCMSPATCENTDGGFNCVCPDGYTENASNGCDGK